MTMLAFRILFYKWIVHVGILWITHSRNAISSFLSGRFLHAFFSFFSPLPSVPIWSDVLWRVVLVVTSDLMPVNYGITANLHMKRKDTVCLLPDNFFPAKQEGTYVILKLYPADEKNFVGKGESNSSFK